MTPIARAIAAALCIVVSASALGGTITGTVRAADTRQPLGSKVVAAYDTAGTLAGTATTDATGQYTLGLPAGQYRVLAYDPEGFYATTFDADAESFETSPVTTVTVTGSLFRDFLLKPGAVVSGVVTGPTGAPRATATVEVYNLSGTRRGFTTTDASGAYSIIVPPGTYKLVAFDANPNLTFSFFRNARAFAEATPLRVEVTPPATGVNFRLDVPARASGRVTDAATGLPLAAITIYAYTPSGALVASTITDAAGTWRLAVPAGDYRFVAADLARTYAPAFFDDSRAFERASTVGLNAGALASNLDFELERGAIVAGIVRDANGAAVPDVTVAAYNLDGTLYTTATTNASGEYALVLAPGAYKLAAFDADQAYATRFLGNAPDFATAGVVGVAAGQQIGAANFVLQRGGRVTGTVREGNTPRAGITVAAYDAAGVLTATANTAADGTYSFVVPPGDYRIVAFDAGLTYAASYDGGANSFDETLPRSVAANATATVDINLRRGTLVRADVVDAAGNLVEGVNIFALDAAGHRVGGAVSVSGFFAMAVPAGAYKFVAIDPRGRYATTYFDRAETLAAATWVTVSDLTEFRFVLDAARLRRRGVRH